MFPRSGSRREQRSRGYDDDDSWFDSMLRHRVPVKKLLGLCFGYMSDSGHPISPKMSHLNFSILSFSINFVELKLTCLVTLFDRKLQFEAKMDQFWDF